VDEVLTTWNTRDGTGMANSGFVREGKGHRGDGDGSGVLGFIQGGGTRIATAGDDGISLVFETPQTGLGAYRASSNHWGDTRHWSLRRRHPRGSDRVALIESANIDCCFVGETLN
jgi:hypothetical protein